MSSYKVLRESVSNYLFDTVEIFIQESGNLSDMNKLFKDAKNTFNEYSNKINKAINAKDYKTASTECDNVKKLLKDIETQINSIDDTVLSAVGNSFYQSLLVLLKAILLGLPTFGVGTVTTVLEESLNGIIGLSRQWKEEKTFKPEMINGRRNKIKGIFSQMYGSIDKYKRIIANKVVEESRKNKLQTMVAESKSIDDLKLVVFESWYSGDITDTERDKIINFFCERGFKEIREIKEGDKLKDNDKKEEGYKQIKADSISVKEANKFWDDLFENMRNKEERN